jgi:bifunctional non-homologous end joining protein LigD
LKGRDSLLPYHNDARTTAISTSVISGVLTGPLSQMHKLSINRDRFQKNSAEARLPDYAFPPHRELMLAAMPRLVSPHAKARFLEPMLCLAVSEIPTGPEWSYEVKLDGYRALGLKTGGRVRLFSRNSKDFSQRFPEVTHALEALPDETLIDGEIVAIDDYGLPFVQRQP